MTKWADYCISAVRYNAAETHIERVQVRVHNADANTISAPTEWARTQVVSAIDRGNTFVTIYERDNHWHKGEDVRVITVNGVKYIRTDTNYKAADNLGNLPRY